MSGPGLFSANTIGSHQVRKKNDLWLLPIRKISERAGPWLLPDNSNHIAEERAGHAVPSPMPAAEF